MLSGITACIIKEQDESLSNTRAHSRTHTPKFEVHTYRTCGAFMATNFVPLNVVTSNSTYDP